MFYAQLDEDICVAVTQAAAEIQAPNLIALESYDTTLIGKRYDKSTGRFVDVPQPEPDLPRHITKRAFRARFTKAERAAIEWASVDRADAPLAERQMAAELRSDLKDQEQAEYIDLDDPDVSSGLQQLAAFGLIEPHRPAEILTAPVQEKERA